MSEQNQKVPPPVLLSVIICDQVILDSITKKPTIVGAFEVISAEKYPARHPNLAFFCQLTNGRGEIPVTIKLIHVGETDTVMWKKTETVSFVDVRQIRNLIFNIGGIIFPDSGEYRLQIFAGEQFLAERRIICRQIELRKS